ncbi:MAG: response regulator transcription factor [Armatimonadetes bacterium]|nr:response regulator transcription factor [Armatimonadota bacterium]
MSVRIAVVEDDETVGASVAYSLLRLGYAVETYEDGAEALRVLTEHPPDVAILDLSLPNVDGLTICRTLRATHPETAIIILTARSEELDRVLGLESGADDYVVKPFSLKELEARVGSILRRMQPRAASAADLLRCGAITLDRNRGTVDVAGRVTSVTRREEEVLAFMMARPGQVVYREQLLEGVWGKDF